MQALDPNRTFPARNSNYQEIQFIRAAINFNDAGIGTSVQIGTLPQYAFIIDDLVEIETVFNAGTTNVLTLGTTVGGSELVAAGDVNEAATGVTAVGRGLGRSLTASGDVGVYAKFAQTGTAATAGKAHFCIAYALPNSAVAPV